MKTLLEVHGLEKTFRYRTGWFRRQRVEAVKPVSFTLREGQTLAIIGENGSGKSTLAKMIAGMIEPSGGEIVIDDHPLCYGDYRYRSQCIRMIFQDPATSLNPRQRIGQILDVPLRLNTDLDARRARSGLINTASGRAAQRSRPTTIRTAGHRQTTRIALARALILQPKVIVADEALASLDMSMRSQIINLMLELQQKHGIAYIYVTQHLGMMKHISDQVLVMQAGQVVERGSTAEVLAAPLHDLTKRLITSHFGEALTADAWRRDGGGFSTRAGRHRPPPPLTKKTGARPLDVHESV
ncbi:putrescine export ABC transporter ATP-binding protein SapF [Edwardsiella ictaluri]